MARKKIGADYGWVGPLAVLAALGITGWIIYNKFPGLFSANSANSQQTTDANTSAAASSAAAATQAGIKATLNANQMANIANQVYSIGTTDPGLGGTVDLGSINAQLTQVNNIADLNGVISAFGTKSISTGPWYSWCSQLGFDCTAVGLGSFVHVVYTSNDSTGQFLENLNNFLSDQGINYTF